MDDVKVMNAMTIRKLKETLPCKNCFIGFDAFIDLITRPIRFNGENNEKEFFSTIGQFASHISSNGGHSKSIEIENKLRKIGGNNPLMSDALAGLGVNVNSIGAYGEGKPDDVFTAMNKNVALYPIAAPGLSIVYEFDDSKLMTYAPVERGKITWVEIAKTITMTELTELIQNSDAIALLNYAEMNETLALWTEIAALLLDNKKSGRIIFFDLSDITKLSKEAISDAFGVMRAFSGIGDTCLSMNENEFVYTYKTFIDPNADANEVGSQNGLAGRMERILRRAGVNRLVYRNINSFYALCVLSTSTGGLGFVSTANRYIHNPRVVTGAGDNQNAGILAGLLCGMDMGQVLALGAATGGYYMENGGSMKDLDDLENYIDRVDDIKKRE